MKYRVEIVDSYDRDNVYYEIWDSDKDKMVGEVFFQNKQVNLYIFESSLSFYEFLDVLKQIDIDIKTNNLKNVDI